MSFRFLVSLGLLLKSFSAATDINLVPFDSITPLKEAYPSPIYKTFQPTLYVSRHGCVSYPAVDEQGDISQGLIPMGRHEGVCRSSIGQVYTRAEVVDGRLGIMYAWYFPKDQVAMGPAGHRHDWESAIIWLNTTSTSPDPTFPEPEILAICPSHHGGWTCDTYNFELDGTHAKIKYKSSGSTHTMYTTPYIGRFQPLVEWSSMSDIVKTALTEADFGSATVPFKDERFVDNLYAARFW